MANERLFLRCVTCKQAIVLAHFTAMSGGTTFGIEAKADAFIEKHLEEHGKWPGQGSWATPPFDIVSEASTTVVRKEAVNEYHDREG